MIHTNFLNTTILCLFYCCEKENVFILINYGWLKKIQYTSLPEKKDFYSHLCKRRYYWQKLHSSEKNLQRFLNIKFRRISWFTYLKPYIKVIRWIWEISKYVSLNNSAWSCKIHFSSLISMGSSYIKDWSKTRIIKQYWYAINGSKRH